MIKVACNKVFIKPIVFLLLYAALIVYGLQLSEFWEWILLKDVILWVLFVATPIVFKAGTQKIKDYPFKRMILDNFIWSAILEFFIGAFTFSLSSEMIIVPVFSLIVILRDFDRDNPKYQQLHKLFDSISIIAGLLLLYFTIKKAVSVIAVDGIVNVLTSFAIPIIFSVAYLPVVYFLAVYAKYHDMFVRFYIRNHCSKEGLRAKKWKTIFTCGLSYKKILLFEKEYYNYIAKIRSANDDETFFEFVEQFKHTNTHNAN